MKTNALSKESSLYLQQHAQNPVNWLPYSDRVFEEAKQANKLILISIGYSACHWCHVMEHECFENEEVAALMNAHLVCVKVDREERPDVDAIYMSAVQLMKSQGGWPLNCFTLPDGRPVFGGTYFPKENWTSIIQQLSDLYENDTPKVLAYAERLSEAMKEGALIELNPLESPFDFSLLETGVANWKWDTVYGGRQGAPKFPMPNNYQFLANYALLKTNTSLLNKVSFTLEKMAMGGIYDQLAGGFARYSVDEAWKVPHFEKMLYDNAQLISLYANVYKCTGNLLFKQVVKQSLHFVASDFTAANGCFYAALDADSEGVEGKYYVWNERELKSLFSESDYSLFTQFYAINDYGYWEHDNYILCSETSAKQLALAWQLTESAVYEEKNRVDAILLNYRNTRIRPGLDTKIICSWNALQIIALCDAHGSFEGANYLDTAIRAMAFIDSNFTKNGTKLYHIYNGGKASVAGFLEDYAFVIAAKISLYQKANSLNYLLQARNLLRFVEQNFSDENACFFNFNHRETADILMHTVERQDNVIPSANSTMALNLFYLASYFAETAWLERAKRMLLNSSSILASYLPAGTNWANLALQLQFPVRLVVVIGAEMNVWQEELAKNYYPNCLFVFTEEEQTAIPITVGKYKAGETLAYVCYANTCQAPCTNLTQLVADLAYAL